MHFFGSGIQYILPKKQSVGSAHEVLPESLEIVFEDEVYFIVNLYNFLLSLALPRYPFTPMSPFSPIVLGRTTFRTPFR